MQTNPMDWTSVRCFCLLGGMPAISDLFPGICALDYTGDDPYPTPDTSGLIVDDVSRR